MVRTVIIMLSFAVIAACSTTESARQEPKETLHTYTVTSQNIQSSIDATGMVQPDLEGGAKILTPAAGSVEEVYVRVGDRVKKGAPLAMLRSADTTDVHSNYLSTLAQLKQTERTYELNKQLFEIGAVTKNDLLASEANYEQVKSAAEGLQKKMEIHGVLSTNGPQDRLILRAPIDGHVVDIQAHIGDRFDTNTALMTLANSRKIVIVANVFDTDMRNIRKGSEVIFSTDVFPDKIFKGVISGISDVEDIDSKTVKVYIKLLDGTELLMQNMFLKINFHRGDRSLPTIPKTALIYKDGKFYVRLKQNEQYELSEVRPVRDVSEKMMAVEGLKENDEIVYSAIDLEKP
jgi:cobalt-zinc-cadmium efflux system membrane fusion protein